MNKSYALKLEFEMRLFIAINLNETMLDSLTGTQDYLYNQNIRGNFTPE